MLVFSSDLCKSVMFKVDDVTCPEDVNAWMEFLPDRV